jgi:excisionase family DNA binding protein
MRLKLLTLREVEELTRLSRPTLYRRLRDGKLIGTKLDNGGWRVAEEEVAKILAGPTKA